mmetsp:Transcript_25031/g.63487  ORF Transcript_25031/g.63487 Transcript_25031/m.63487 type:complete len:258 (-) Transcript_25031:1591-2364(-)
MAICVVALKFVEETPHRFKQLRNGRLELFRDHGEVFVDALLEVIERALFLLRVEQCFPLQLRAARLQCAYLCCERVAQLRLLVADAPEGNVERLSRRVGGENLSGSGDLQQVVELDADAVTDGGQLALQITMRVQQQPIVVCFAVDALGVRVQLGPMRLPRLFRLAVGVLDAHEQLRVQIGHLCVHGREVLREDLRVERQLVARPLDLGLDLARVVGSCIRNLRDVLRVGGEREGAEVCACQLGEETEALLAEELDH